MAAKFAINRAPVLTLWAAVVGERLGLPHATALTCARAVTGMTAHSKGARLGIYAPPELRRSRRTTGGSPQGVRGDLRAVQLLGRSVQVGDTAVGPLAVSHGEVLRPAWVEHYLAARFGEHMDTARTALERLADSVSTDELERRAFHLYLEFRPEAPDTPRGRSAKGILDLERVDALARREVQRRRSAGGVKHG